MRRIWRKRRRSCDALFTDLQFVDVGDREVEVDETVELVVSAAF